MMRTKQILWETLIILLCLGANASLFADVDLLEKQEKKNDYEETLDYQKGRVTVAAYGRPSPYIEGSMAEKLIFAMTEARKKAYTRMAAFLANIRIDGENTLENGYLVDNTFKMRFDQLVRNAREIDHERFLEKDGSVLFRSTIALIFPGKNGLNRILIPKLKEKARQSPPKQYNNPVGFTPQSEGSVFDPKEKYSGLVIDARALAIRPAMAPRILAADGKEIYGMLKIDSTYAIEQGIVGYAKDLTMHVITDRIGKHPLIIKAQRAHGPNRADVIVSNNIAGQILWADKNSHFLSECRVVFLVK